MGIYTYLLKSIIVNNYYTGISENPERRLFEHNSGKVKITAKNRPYILVYKKLHNSYAEARKHEIWLKKKNRIYKNRISKEYLSPPHPD